MIAISENVKDAIESIEPKNLILEFDDGTIIDNEDIAMESMELTQSITEDDTLRFGEINSSCFKVEITGSPKKYKGLWFNASLHCGDYSVPLGKFCVDSDEYTSGRQYRSIVAYDALAYVTNTDVTEWYEKLKFPISIRNMRNSLFSFLDIEQEDVTLINDAYMVEKTIAGEEISALMVLRAICELNATFGVINNYGKFKYVKINNLERAGLNPSEELYTEDVYDDVLTKADYFQDSLTFEEFDTEKITKLRIQEVENDIGVSVGEDGNEYIITDNFLTYGDTEENIRVVVENLFNYAKHLTYTPTEVSCTGKPWLEVGDMLQVYADDKVLNVPILSRTLSGIQSIIDSYTAQGTEYCEEPQENGLQTEIRKLKSRSNVLTRTLDETISEISRIETETKKYTDEAIKESTSNTNSKIEEKLKSYSTTTEMNSKIEQTANSLNSSINEKVNETKTYINGEITTTKNELSNQIEQTSSSLKSEISKNYVTNGSLQEATNYLQQQIDGAIETFSGSSVPTLSNSPASGWETNEIKDTHVGDLYIVNSSGGDHAGFYYRFEKFGNTYKWTLLKDNEITKALQDAKEANEKAQEVARELAENYITESETKSAIDQATNKIQLAVSEKYSTKAEVTSAKSEAISSANANTANQLKNYSTTADSKAYANSVSNSALENAKKYTDDVEVGGRNLLLNSDFSLSKDVWGSYLPKIQTEGDFRFVEQGYEWGCAQSVALEHGQTYTVSATVRLKAGSKLGSFRLAIENGVNRQNVFIEKLSEDWKRMSATFDLNIPSSSYKCYFLSNSANNNAVIQFGELKLEKGNRATDWTPAPEDVEADATNKANSALESAKANTDAKLVSYSTTAEMNSAIELKANSITNSVNEKITETKKYADSVGGNAVANANQNTENLLREYSTTTEMNSAIEQKSNSIISTVDEKYTSKTEFQNLQIGGRNLWLKTKEYNAKNYIGWVDNNNGTHVDASEPYMTINGFGVQRIAYAWRDISQRVAVEQNTYYTLSAWIKWENEVGVMQYYGISCFPMSVDVTSQVGIDNYKRVSVTFNTKDTTISTCRFECTTSIPYLIYGLKLEKGNRATDWTPAPEDVESDATNKANSAEANAKKDTADKLKSYTTTTDMNSKIEQTASNIVNEVSKTYTTKTDFQNLEIGGRNLLLKSDVKKSNANYSVAFYYFGGEKPVEGEQYTITIKGTLGADRHSFRAYNSGGNVHFGMLTNKGNGLYTYTGEWVITSGSTTAPNTYINIYQFYNSGTTASTIEWIKLEKGNRATDWTPAPEDVESDISSAKKEAIEEAKSYINQTADNIDIAVSKKVGYDELISSINLSAEGAKINASKIDIAGAVTFSSLSNDVKNAIDLAGANASSANTNASSALNSVNNSVKSVTLHYLATSANSGVTTSTSGWTTTPQNITSTKKYLWTYQTVTSISGTSTNSTPVISGVYGDKGATGATGAKGDKGDKGATGATGATGKSIGTIINYYLATASSSGVTASTSGWTTTVQSVSASKKYLWNYEVIKYSDGTVASTSTPCIIGAYGDTGAKGDKGDKGATGATGSVGATGNGISSIKEYYQVSTSNTTAPTSWVTTVPTMTATNKYLWNYETITYTNGSTATTAKRVIGVYGDKGATGATGATGAKGDKGDKGATGSAGATGVGISNVVPLYYLKSNATAPSAPTSAVASASTSHSVWTTAIPNYVNGYTYFTCTQTLYTNGTYKWSAVVADNALTSANKNAYDANIKANDVANTTVRKYSYTIDLSNTTTYNEDTYYPVIGGQIPKGGYRSLSVAVQLNSGTKPAWSTHTAGFTCNLAVRVKQWGWGTATDHMGWIDDASYKFCNKMPAYFQQMGNSSLPVFYLRGGGKYFLYADYPSTWTPHTSTYTSNSQSVSPTTTPSNWSYLANNWRMETAIANWCHDNNVTYIDGSKIYAGTVSAKQINVNELFAQKITIQDSVSPVPTQMDVDLINRYTIGNVSLNSTQLKLYDFNGDGKVTTLDAIYAKKLSTGELTYDDLPNYIPTKASATLKLSFSNLNEVIKIYGDSPFQAGKYETSIGAGEIKTQSVTATQANLKSLFIDGTQINLLIKDESMDGYNLYTTAAWSAGSGGFLWLCEEAGWYYIDVTFYGVSGTMDNAQFQIFRSSGGVHTSLITVGFVWNWTGTMPMQHVQTIQYLNKNDAIYPYVHTGIAGVQLNTGIRALRLAGQ